MCNCAGRGALGGARRSRGAGGGQGCRAKGLDGAGDGESLKGPLVRGLLPRVIHPPQNGFPLGDALQLAPGALRLPPVPFLPVEEARFRMVPPHQGPPQASKIVGWRQTPGGNWFGDGGQGFSRQGFFMSMPSLRAATPPPPHPCCGCGAAKGGEMPSAWSTPLGLGIGIPLGTSLNTTQAPKPKNFTRKPLKNTT